MPSFIRTEKDEGDWQRAKSIIRRQYPRVREGSEQFWKLVNHVFHSVSGRKPKSVSEEILDCMSEN